MVLDPDAGWTWPRVALASVVLLAAMACGLTSAISPNEMAPATSDPPTATPAPAQTPTPTPVPVDLSEDQLIWFGPLPPLSVTASRPLIGPEDYMELFEPDAPWQSASEYVDVALLYGEWQLDDPWIEHASDAELKRAILDLNGRGIALALEVSPLTKPADCGTGIESWSGPQAALRNLRRVQAAGGRVHFVAMDAPYADASLPTGPGACEWTPEEVTARIRDFKDRVHEEFPHVVIGDTEPLWADLVTVDTYRDWMATYAEVTGEELPFLHLDIDYSARRDWPEATLALEGFARQRGVDFGAFYLGSLFSRSDANYLGLIGERVLEYEEEYGGELDHVMFQSWFDHPEATLPEDQPATFISLIVNYVENGKALGYEVLLGEAALAYKKPVRASGEPAGSPADFAVNGDPGTWWSAGAGPVQWIEVDLGEPEAIAGHRLTISQSPPGDTEHRVHGQGPWTDGAETLLHTFAGRTQAMDVLTHTPEEPWEGIRFVRVETVQSPSWVFWREISLIGPAD